MRIKTKIKLTNKALSRQYMIFVPSVVDVLGNIRKKVEKYSTVVLIQKIIL